MTSSPASPASAAHLKFLNELRESGRINMFGARPYLHEAFPELSRKETQDILEYWMRTFTP